MWQSSVAALALSAGRQRWSGAACRPFRGYLRERGRVLIGLVRRKDAHREELSHDGDRAAPWRATYPVSSSNDIVAAPIEKQKNARDAHLIVACSACVC
jgi:hypothetical protein